MNDNRTLRSTREEPRGFFGRIVDWYRNARLQPGMPYADQSFRRLHRPHG